MEISQRGRELIDRAERAGAPINKVALSRKFNFTISGIVTVGIDIAIFVQLAELISSYAERDNFSCELKNIVLFPIISDPEIYSREDFTTYKRKDSSFFVGRNIDVEIWRRVRKPRRLALATEMLISSVNVISAKHLSLENKERLMTIVERASKELGQPK